MQPTSFAILLAAAGLVVMAGLWLIGLVRGRAAWPCTGTDLLLAMLAAMSLAGVLGLGWFVEESLRYDGFMAEEFAMAAALAVVLAATIAGAWALRSRRARGWAVLVALIGALPTAAAFGLLLLIQAQGMDMR